MRPLVGGLVIALVYPVSTLAQERDPSLARISLALQRPSLFVASVTSETSTAPTKFGIVTFVPPTGRGEMVRVSVPIGELISRAVKGVAAANQRRQEAAARREVETALKEFKSRSER